MTTFVSNLQLLLSKSHDYFLPFPLMNPLPKRIVAFGIAALAIYFLVIPGAQAFFAGKPDAPIYLEKNPEYQQALGHVTQADLILREYGEKSAYGRQQLTVRYKYSAAYKFEGRTAAAIWEEGQKSWAGLSGDFFAPKHAVGDTVMMYFPANAPTKAEPRNLHFDVYGVAQQESDRQNAITFGLIGLFLSLLLLVFALRKRPSN